jgi:hypothetical protein
MPITRKLANQLDRICKDEDALLVLIVKPDSGYISADPRLAPEGAIETLRNEIPALQDYLTQRRTTR